jgi:crossover junction endodeoxyribonuclease RuvC|nr:MAG TPA: HOLLIDAY JUNCTION RESOLVASE [Caudoviricetes sp.]
MIYIGIDPGKNGGIAVINDKFPKPVNITVYKYSDDDLIDVIDVCTKGSSIAVHRDEEIKCVLEKVNAMPGQGVVSMFNFGQNFGFIQGVLKAYEIPFELVPPQKWKKEFSVTSDKNTSIEVAKRLFPGVNLKATDRCRKDHDGMAEALLIAEYGRRHYNGTL